MKRINNFVLISIFSIVSLGFMNAKVYSQEKDYYTDINEECGFWLTINKNDTLIRTILAGECSTVTAIDYLEAFESIITKEGIKEKKYSIDVFYINLRKELSKEKERYLFFKKKLLTIINSSFSGTYEIKEEDPELLKIVKNKVNCHGSG